MKRLSWGGQSRQGPSILIFTEGTVLKPKTWLFLYSFRSYVPAGDCVEKIRGWQEQGANILYCTSRKGKGAEVIADRLRAFGFPGICLVAREKKEAYKHIVERIKPDILIEDNCKSIGGARQMCITYVDPAIKAAIHAIAVPEYKGIDHLPGNLAQLTSFG